MVSVGGILSAHPWMILIYDGVLPVKVKYIIIIIVIVIKNNHDNNKNNNNNNFSNNDKNNNNNTYLYRIAFSVLVKYYYQ